MMKELFETLALGLGVIAVGLFAMAMALILNPFFWIAVVAYMAFFK